MSSYKVDIFTPSSVVAKELSAKSLLVPTTRGQINLLEDHTHMITKLATGILTVTDGNSETHFSMTTGVCKILNDKVTILSAVTEQAHEIDFERAKAALEKAQEKLKSDSLTDLQLIKYRRKIERAEVRIKMAYLGKGAP